jgi:hypothetical protein
MLLRIPALRVSALRVSALRLPAVLVLALGLGACGKSATAKTQSTLTVHPVPGRALSGMEGKDLVVLPVAYLRADDKLGWAAEIKNPRDYLRHVDTLIQQSLEGHAYRIKWVFPPALRRAADRSAGMIQDPDALSEQQLLPGVWKANAPLYDPLAEQVRSVISTQNSRYVLAPVELRFLTTWQASGEPAPPASVPPAPPVQMAVLRVALLDAQGTYVIWGGDVLSDTARTADAAVANLTNKLGALLGTP